ncbi:MAG TPA: ribokinase [Steroidobacteraceae bacterium]|jgi:ribokinase|nr:ribokinase [Steroidobacteraceae bacterium]
MAAIIVLGSLNMDIAALGPRLPQAGETLMGSRFYTAPGGKGGNQAYAAAKLGGAGSTAMLGRVGEDDFGPQMIASLVSVGCSVEGVRQLAGRSGVALNLIAESGQNSIMVVAGANDRFVPDDVAAAAPLLRGARFALLQLEVPLPTTIAGATAARAAGLEVILDPAPAPAHLPTELLKFVDVLTPNETEAAQLVGRKAADVSVDEARTIAAELQSRGVRHVIIKLGAKGCLLLEAATATHVPAPMVKAVDSTGAGDIFNAAFVVACSEGASRLDACEFAVHAAALSATRMGCQASVPTRVELNAYLRQT